MDRHNRWFWIVILLFAVMLGSCDDPGGNPTPTPAYPISEIRMEAAGIFLFWEDFEDGDLDNGNTWGSGGHAYHWKRVLTDLAGNHFLVLDGPEVDRDEHFGGLGGIVSNNKLLPNIAACASC